MTEIAMSVTVPSKQIMETVYTNSTVGLVSFEQYRRARSV